MLQGSLDNFTLAEVLGLLANTAKTGKLALTGDRGQGSLWFDEGQLIAAEAANSSVDSELHLTLFELLRFQSGTFAFEADGQTPSVTQDPADVETVLSTAQDRMTEWVDIEAVIPSVWHRLTPAMSLPSAEVTIDSNEWDLLIAVGETSTVGAVSDRLDLDEFDGSKRVMELLDRGLIDIADPAAVQKGDPLAGLTEAPLPEVASAADSVADLAPVEVPAALAAPAPIATPEPTIEPAPVAVTAAMFEPDALEDEVPMAEAATLNEPTAVPAAFDIAPVADVPIAEPAPIFEPAPVAPAPAAATPHDAPIEDPAASFEPAPSFDPAPVVDPFAAPVDDVPAALRPASDQPTSAEELFALVIDHDNAGTPAPDAFGTDAPAPVNSQNSAFAVDNGLLSSEERPPMPPPPTPPSPSEIDSFSSQLSDSSQIDEVADTAFDPDAFDPATFDPASLVVDDGQDSVLMQFLKTDD